MEDGVNQETKWEGYADWRNRPALKGIHGGVFAASFVLVVEVLENLAYLANASNLVMYLSKYMHLSPSKSANNVTNFMGTAFLLALLGGFLSDTFITTYHIYLISAFIEFLGLIILTIQARTPSLKPPSCRPSASSIPCEEVSGAKAGMLFIGLYLVALGIGGIKGSLPTHGAEQFDETTPKGRKQRSTFFNYFVFSLSFGALIAVTFVVWIEDNKGWEWGFAISTISILLSIPIFLAGSMFYRNKIPFGSPLTTICKVLVAAKMNSCVSRSPSNVIVNLAASPSYQIETGKGTEENGKQNQIPTNSLKFLNRAVVNSPACPALECSVQQVEEVKIVLKILPIFACTIVLNCCLAQLSTFSVEQAATMNTKLGSLKIPPASLPVFPVVFIMILAPVYDHFIIPFARRLTKTETGISQLQRIGIGLFLSTIAMAVAALIEIKRKRVAISSGLLDSNSPLPITFFWIALQYLFLGSADLFTLAGLLEFFFTETPSSMRSLATSLCWASLAMGYYLSSVIVSIVNNVTESSGNKPWLSGHTINGYRLDRFYWLMCVLSVLNFMHYLFWAMRYKYISVGSYK
ncbi:Protein NRT1/ PTR FAMILY 4.6 [Hibiscus syriacus]|uniref:Protein NRT1/ PTR FAMILY 4.6 n=1 Tax=Hibiscus syriacus TaxID=106335 RepID=A0A6A2WFN3_HIBSY|nr:protein NRT1/ PTR FAMILY 4.6-like isoform X2 [Hibiscus syriacus]KAE8657443.1 Protein NRT1/ PTR FAMILY 4.6 [Hibiscus syriacus]